MVGLVLIMKGQRSGNPAIRHALVGASAVDDIDASGVEVLHALGIHAGGARLALYFATVKHLAARILDKSGHACKIAT